MRKKTHWVQPNTAFSRRMLSRKHSTPRKCLRLLKMTAIKMRVNLTPRMIAISKKATPSLTNLISRKSMLRPKENATVMRASSALSAYWVRCLASSHCSTKVKISTKQNALTSRRNSLDSQEPISVLKAHSRILVKLLGQRMCFLNWFSVSTKALLYSIETLAWSRRACYPRKSWAWW